MAGRRITNPAFARFVTGKFGEDTPISSVASAISRKSKKNVKNGLFQNADFGFSDFSRLIAF